MIPVFDSNILIDFLNQRPGAEKELYRYPKRLLSIVSWIEVLAGAKTEDTRKKASKACEYFDVVDVTSHIAQHAVIIRQKYRIALPDAIIWATAKVHKTLLITRNTRDFPEDEPDIRIPYQL